MPRRHAQTAQNRIVQYRGHGSIVS
jgi:hypothetical protein